MKAQVSLIALDGRDLEVRTWFFGPGLHARVHIAILIVDKFSFFIRGALLLHAVDGLSRKEGILQLCLAVGEVVLLGIKVIPHIVQTDPIGHGIGMPLAVDGRYIHRQTPNNGVALAVVNLGLIFAIHIAPLTNWIRSPILSVTVQALVCISMILMMASKLLFRSSAFSAVKRLW